MAAQPAQISHLDDDPENGIFAPTSTGFSRLSELPLFSPADATAERLASPLLAHAWADAIVHFWETGIAAGSIDPAQPLYLFDLAPGGGELAWLLIAALKQQLVTRRLCVQPCYVACSADPARLAYLESHPYLAQYADEGWLDCTSWQAGTDETLTLRRQDVALLRTENPVVLLCLEWFQSLPSDLYGVENGHIMEGLAAIRGERIAYDWQVWEEPVSAPSMLRPLLAHYRGRCTGVPLLLPVAACEAIDTFHRLSAGRYLMLSADPGSYLEQHARLGAFAPPATWRRDVATAPLPVNYHAISLHQHAQGARTWNRQLEEGGVVLHAAWRDDNAAIPAAAFSGVVACLNDMHPEDNRRLAAALTDSPPQHLAENALTLLRHARHDPHVLKACIRALIEHPLSLTDVTRQTWRTALARTWANYLPGETFDTFYYDAGLLAIQLEHWGLAKEIFRLGIALYGDNATDLHHLAFCEAHSGGVESANALILRALELEPGNPHCLALQDELGKRLQRWCDTAWYHPHAARADALTLEPLGIEHAHSLFYQYRDQQIGILTRLPELNTPGEAQDWIETQAAVSGRCSYAVMHDTWGFIGVVSMQCADDAAYFYFWTGSDFQDSGWGTAAARLLFRQAARIGIADVFTSVYLDNERSCIALERLGFRELTVKAESPDDDLLFLHLAMNDATRMTSSASQLRELCTAIASPFVFLDEAARHPATSSNDDPGH